MKLFYAQFINLPRYVVAYMHNHKNYGNFVKNVNNELEKNLSKRTSFKSIGQIIACLRRSVNDKNAIANMVLQFFLACNPLLNFLESKGQDYF